MSIMWEPGSVMSGEMASRGKPPRARGFPCGVTVLAIGAAGIRERVALIVMIVLKIKLINLESCLSRQPVESGGDGFAIPERKAIAMAFARHRSADLVDACSARPASFAIPFGDRSSGGGAWSGSGPVCRHAANGRGRNRASHWTGGSIGRPSSALDGVLSSPGDGGQGDAAMPRHQRPAASGKRGRYGRHPGACLADSWPTGHHRRGPPFLVQRSGALRMTADNKTAGETGSPAAGPDLSSSDQNE